MGTKIEWTDETWNPLRARNRETGKIGHFCVHHSPGCKFCYAELLQKRFGNPVRYAAQDADKVELFLDEKVLMQPLSWRKPRMVFVCSMTDLFYEGYSDDLIDKVFAVMALAPQHTFQVLTKRAERMRDYLCAEPEDRINAEAGTLMHFDDMPQRDTGPLSNVWLGVSVEDRARLDRVDRLRETPGANRFLSLEPLLEDLGEFDLTGIDWVIVGGESGPNARPMHPEWARSIRDQCQAAGAPFFFKQWGEWLPCQTDRLWQDGHRGLRFERHERPSLKFVGWRPDGQPIPADTEADRIRFRDKYGPPRCVSLRLGKKRAGRLLDGRTWEEMPA